MTRRYGAFLVHCWVMDAECRRIVIEHVQSGERVIVASDEAALAWIAARLGETVERATTGDGEASWRRGQGE